MRAAARLNLRRAVCEADVTALCFPFDPWMTVFDRRPAILNRLCNMAFLRCCRRAAMTKTVAKAVAVVLMMSFVAACATKPAPSPAPVVRKG
jgi:hypothetical protein